LIKNIAGGDSETGSSLVNGSKRQRPSATSESEQLRGGHITASVGSSTAGESQYLISSSTTGIKIHASLGLE
jgi:hypothetical protein